MSVITKPKFQESVIAAEKKPPHREVCREGFTARGKALEISFSHRRNAWTCYRCHFAPGDSPRKFPMAHC